MSALAHAETPVSAASGEGYVARMAADSRRVPSLDGLRAVSILLVLFSHFINPRLIPGGLGVLLFFVISGFLITRLMFAEWQATSRLSIGGFYWRRLWRLYPAVVAYCIAVVAYCVLTGKPFNLVEPFSALFYYANIFYIVAAIRGTAAHMPFADFWSLSVEEHFYWIFPILFVFGARGRAPWLAKAMVAVCVLSLFARMVTVWMWPRLADTPVLYWSDLRLDSIAFGVLIASLGETERGRHLLAALTHPGAAGLAVLGLAICLLWRDPFFRATFRFSLEAASVSILLVAILFSQRYSRLQRLLNLRAAIWIGALSYSLYVWNALAAIVVSQMFPSLSRVDWFVAAMAVTFGTAAASYYFIEAPLRAYYAGRRPAKIHAAELQTEPGSP